MLINGKEVREIIVTAPSGEVLAVISDSEIIEKNGVDVIVDGVYGRGVTQQNI